MSGETWEPTPEEEAYMAEHHPVALAEVGPPDPCDVCLYEREDCNCWEYGEEGVCHRCGGTGERIPEHCCQCGGGIYDCTCCSRCGAYVGTCGCKIEVATHDGKPLSV